MTDADASDDRVLVDRAARGCTESFSVLAARHQVGVVHYVRRLLGTVGGHEDDLVQETFLAAFRHLDRYDDSFAFSTWLFTIARRACLNHLRSARRRARRETAHVRSGPISALERPDGVAADREERERMWDIAADALPEKQFTALWLHYVEGLPTADVGRVLGRPAATVKVMLCRARRRLAAAISAAESGPAPVIVRLPRQRSAAEAIRGRRTGRAQ